MSQENTEEKSHLTLNVQHLPGICIRNNLINFRYLCRNIIAQYYRKIQQELNKKEVTHINVKYFAV